MTRKWLVRIIAFLFVVQGLWELGVFLSPIFAPSGSISFNFFFLIVGVVELIAGVSLLRLVENGRRLTNALLIFRIFINSFFISWALRQNDFGFAIKYFGKAIFESSSRSVFIFILFVWLLLAIGAFIFLNQKATKDIFVSKAGIGEKDNTSSDVVSAE